MPKTSASGPFAQAGIEPSGTVGRKPAPAQPQRNRCRLTLTINGTDYALRSFASPDGRVWILRRAEGHHHHVAPTAHGWTCNCGDWTWRREHRDPAGCKHIRALRAVGLIGEDRDE